MIVRTCTQETNIRTVGKHGILEDGDKLVRDTSKNALHLVPVAHQNWLTKHVSGMCRVEKMAKM